MPCRVRTRARRSGPRDTARGRDRRDAAVGDRCVLKATSWRVGEEKDLPASIREYLDQQPKMWREAPRDMDEIEALRAGKVDA